MSLTQRSDTVPQGINAPLLKGEGNWEKIGLHAGPEARALSCCDAMLAHIPFWLKALHRTCTTHTHSAACRPYAQPLFALFTAQTT